MRQNWGPLKKSNLPVLSRKQLNNLKSRLNYARNGKPTLELNILIEWCKNNSNIPDDYDKVFCGDYNYSLDEDNEIDTLCILVTTKRLIGLTKKGNY